MRSLTHFITTILLVSTLVICVTSIEGNIKEGAYMYWMCLGTSLMGLGAQIMTIIAEIREEMLQAEALMFDQTTFEGR